VRSTDPNLRFDRSWSRGRKSEPSQQPAPENRGEALDHRPRVVDQIQAVLHLVPRINDEAF
jgi:hypothetical protein